MEDNPYKLCVTCEWWALNGQRCVRKAPTRDLDQRAVWPVTGPLMKCGDWETCSDKNELLKRKITLQEISMDNQEKKDKRVWTHEEIMLLSKENKVRVLQDINSGRAAFRETKNPYDRK